jgi:hypothetical protein
MPELQAFHRVKPARQGPRRSHMNLVRQDMGAAATGRGASQLRVVPQTTSYSTFF